MAMFDWKGSALGLTGKMLAGALAFKDVDPKIIAERVCDQMPFLPEKLGSNAKALIKSRADAAWNGEIIPLIEPRYANTLDLIEELIINERKKLEVYDIYRAQADYLLMKGDMVTYPCCYTRWQPDNPNLGYIGDTSNKIRERDKGHGNAHHILTRVYYTTNYETAHRFAEAIATAIKEKYRCRIEGRKKDKLTLFDATIEEAVDYAINLPVIQAAFRGSIIVDDTVADVLINPTFQDIKDNIDYTRIAQRKERNAKAWAKSKFSHNRPPSKSNKRKIK